MGYVTLSAVQKKQIYDRHAHLNAEGKKCSFRDLAMWAMHEFALPKLPGRTSISRILQDPSHFLAAPQESDPNNEPSSGRRRPPRYVPLTDQQKNRLRQERTRLRELGDKPTLMYLCHWAKENFSLSQAPGKATLKRIFASSATAPSYPSTQQVKSDTALCNEVSKTVEIRRREGTKYISLTSVERKRIRDEAMRIIREGRVPSNQQLAEWAKDQFKLDKLPGKQTIARVLRQSPQLAFFPSGNGIRKKRQRALGNNDQRQQSTRALLRAASHPHSPEGRNTFSPIVATSPAASSVHPTTQLSTGMTSPLTTHALDTSTGRPAAGLALELYRREDDDTESLLHKCCCDSNGRVSSLISQSAWIAGVYRIRFMTEQYFALTNTECFYPYCDVTFTVRNKDSHYHVPLLISPFGFTTYRGS